MSLDLSSGGRAEVAFSFFAGQAGVSSVDANREATVAVRAARPRGAFGATGIVDGTTVEVLAVGKSPVDGYTRVTVRFPSE